jgi:hypothetical protein
MPQLAQRTASIWRMRSGDVERLAHFFERVLAPQPETHHDDPFSRGVSASIMTRCAPLVQPDDGVRGDQSLVLDQVAQVESPPRRWAFEEKVRSSGSCAPCRWDIIRGDLFRGGLVAELLHELAAGHTLLIV